MDEIDLGEKLCGARLTTGGRENERGQGVKMRKIVSADPSPNAAELRTTLTAHMAHNMLVSMTGRSDR